jgi:hypothetical protein
MRALRPWRVLIGERIASGGLVSVTMPASTVAAAIVLCSLLLFFSAREGSRS